MATRDVSLVKLVEPEFISLVNTPANQTGFKIIRSIQEEREMAHPDRNIRVRAKSKRADGLLSVDFPEGLSNDEAEELMDSFALGEDYELVVNDSGNYYAKRTGDNLDEEVTPIELGNGFVANISSATLATRSDNTITGVSLIGLEFDETFEDIKSVEGWLDDHEVNFKKDGIESLEGGHIVTRHDTPKDVEVRKVRLGDGVTGLVSKTKDDDVPQKVYRSVIEQSYGNWGWGHLNFATALADPAFTDASWDAIYVLRDVLENVVLYSGLPLDDRKVLIQNVCDQFTQYMTSLIDSLPREVIEQARADRKIKQEPDDMAISKEDDKKAKRTDSDDVSKKEDDSTEKEEKHENEYVKRSDLKQIVSEAIADALAPKGDDEVKRSDEDKEEDKTSDTGDINKDDMVSAMATMTATMTTIGETMTSITRSIDGVKDDIEELNGGTVTRSDDEDNEATEEDIEEAKTKREDASPFDGMFGDRFKQ